MTCPKPNTSVVCTFREIEHPILQVANALDGLTIGNGEQAPPAGLIPPPSRCVAPFHGVHRVVWGSAGGSHPEAGRRTEEARKVRRRLDIRVRPAPSNKMDRPIEAPPVWRSVVRKGVDVPPCIRRRRVLGKGNISGAPIREKFRDLHHSGSTDVGAEHVVRVERHEAVDLLALEDL